MSVGVERGHTFRPIHLIVPTSLCVNGLKIRSTVSFLPVRLPGSRMDAPEKTSISTEVAVPTSRLESTGSPMSGVPGVEVEEVLGKKRTSRVYDDMARCPTTVSYGLSVLKRLSMNLGHGEGKCRPLRFFFG